MPWCEGAIQSEARENYTHFDPEWNRPQRVKNSVLDKCKQDRIKAAREQRQALVARCPSARIYTEVICRDEEFLFKDGRPFKLIKGLQGQKHTLTPYKRVSDFRILCEMYNLKWPASCCTQRNQVTSNKPCFRACTIEQAIQAISRETTRELHKNLYTPPSPSISSCSSSTTCLAECQHSSR